MKRLLIVSLTLLLIVPALCAASEVFWNPEDDNANDATITDKDFLYHGDPYYPAKSFQEMDIYFSDSQESAPVVRQRARRRAPVVDTGAAETAPRRYGPRPSVTPAPTLRKPVEKPTQALKPAAKPVEVRTKKTMKWGQVEVKPAEPKMRSPLRWGEKAR